MDRLHISTGELGGETGQIFWHLLGSCLFLNAVAKLVRGFGNSVSHANFSQGHDPIKIGFNIVYHIRAHNYEHFIHTDELLTRPIC